MGGPDRHVHAEVDHIDPEDQAVRAFARALLALARQLQEEARADGLPLILDRHHSADSRYGRRSKAGPHRANGRPHGSNPVQEGQNVSQSTDRDQAGGDLPCAA